MISNTDLAAEERRQPRARAIQGNYMKIQSENNNDTGQEAEETSLCGDVTSEFTIAYVRGLKYPILFLNRVSNVPLSIFPTLFAAIHNDIVLFQLAPR